MAKPFTIKIGDLDIKMRSFRGVVWPTTYSRLLARSLRQAVDTVRKGRAVQALDLGCGIGIQAVAMALLGVARSVAVDIDEKCVNATAFNALLNGVSEWGGGVGSQVTALVSNLDEGLPDDDVFDLIVCNPPSLPSFSDASRFADGGPTGREFLESVMDIAAKRLRPGGILQVVHSSLSGIEKSKIKCQQIGLKWNEVNRVEIEFEPCYLAHLDYYLGLRDTGLATFRANEEGTFVEDIFVIQMRKPE